MTKIACKWLSSSQRSTKPFSPEVSIIPSLFLTIKSLPLSQAQGRASPLLSEADFHHSEVLSHTVTEGKVSPFSQGKVSLLSSFQVPIMAEEVILEMEVEEAKVAPRIMAKADLSPVCSVLKETGPLIPHPLSLRDKMSWWQRHAHPAVVSLIKDGVCPPWTWNQGPDLLRPSRAVVSADKMAAARDLLKEYTEIGAVEELVRPPI